MALGKTIADIIDEECSKGMINPGELRSDGRRSRITACRADIASRAMTELGLSAVEIARNLGVTTSTMSGALCYTLCGVTFSFCN